MSDTPETDAFREVVFAQYKEDELTGNGMGNILAALPDIESLERERDDALRKLESLEESITSLDHPNIRILLRQAESYALDVAEKHEKRYCEIKKQLADSNVHLENITIERDSERALADSLAEELKELLYCDLDVNLGRLKSSRDALTAWKEARGE